MPEFKRFRFRHHKISCPSTTKNESKFLFCPQFIDFSAPKNGSEECRHTETMLAIPPPSSELLKALDELRTLQCSVQKKGIIRSRRRKPNTNMAKKVSRINGFTAFKSYYSQNITSVCQGTISSKLSKVWQIEKNQDVWDNYARHYRRYQRKEPFCVWLLRATQNNSIDKQKTHSFTKLNDGDENLDIEALCFNLNEDSFTKDLITTQFSGDLNPYSNYGFDTLDFITDSSKVSSDNIESSNMNDYMDGLSPESCESISPFDIIDSTFSEPTSNHYDYMFIDSPSDSLLEDFFSDKNVVSDKNCKQPFVPLELNKDQFLPMPELWVSLNSEYSLSKLS